MAGAMEITGWRCRLAIAGLTASTPTLIDETACIETSFPGFITHYWNY